MTQAIDRRVPPDQTGAWCVSAPVRIDFTGGYTDVPPVTDDHDGNSVNAAIALPTHVCARPRDDARIIVHSENLGTTVEAASAAGRAHHRDRNPQHAAGGARLGLHRLLLHGHAGGVGRTDLMFTNPREERTEAYITGRFG